MTAGPAGEAMEQVKLVECPRDAWQGLSQAIPTAEKARYLRLLIECGFRHIDAVSFVSPKYVPQMADSEAVLAELGRDGEGLREVEIIGIVVNEAGLERAGRAPQVTTVGYPHSLSAAFLEANAHTTIERSRELAASVMGECERRGRQAVIYISMAFGNPYQEAWSAEAVAAEVNRLREAGARAISLADTVGLAGCEEIRRLLGSVMAVADGVEIGVHLHSRPEEASEKVLAAYEGGCRRFDAALTGLGGCPFAGDSLVGNIPTEAVVTALKRRGAQTGIAPVAVVRAMQATLELRERYGER